MSYANITIGGKERGLKFNNLSQRIIDEEARKRIKEKDGEYADIMYSYIIFYAGLRGCCFVKGEEPEFTFEEVCDWVDKIESVDDVMKVTNVYKEFVGITDELPKEEKKSQPKKKKTTGQSA